jgi:large conductance mechanosensitive channel
MWKEFKTFIMRGNVIDLAVGVIIGGAFGKIISSLVSDLIMPLISLVLGRINFADRFIALDGKTYESLANARDLGGAVLAYGSFIQATIDFLIIAFVIFLAIRGINRMTAQPSPEPEAPSTKECPYCFSEISIQATRCPRCTSELA